MGELLLGPIPFPAPRPRAAAGDLLRSLTMRDAGGNAMLLWRCGTGEVVGLGSAEAQRGD